MCVRVRRPGAGGAGRSGLAKQKWTDEEEAALRAGVAKCAGTIMFMGLALWAHTHS